MRRPTASDVSALSGIVAYGRQTVILFPSPPLKFRTAGFPQYGFKPDCSTAVFGRWNVHLPYLRPIALTLA